MNKKINGTQHGVYMQFGKFPQKMTWDMEFIRWGQWPHLISYRDYLRASAMAMARKTTRYLMPCEETRRVSRSMLLLKRRADKRQE